MRGHTVRAVVLLPVLLPVALLCACDSSRIISGVYQSGEAVLIEGAQGFDQPRRVEMMLAQFGPDITGIVRVFDDDLFVTLADGMCDCRYLEKGTVSGNEVTISFRSPGDCPGNDRTGMVVGRFVFEEPVVVDEDSGDVLNGAFIVEGGDIDAAPRVLMRRVRTWKQVGESDLSCDDPIVHRTGVAAGGAR